MNLCIAFVSSSCHTHNAGYSLPADDVSLSGSYYRNNSVEERLEAGGNGAETTENDDKGTSDLGQDKEVGNRGQILP